MFFFTAPKRRWRLAIAPIFTTLLLLTSPAGASEFGSLLAEGLDLRNHGNISLSIQTLLTAREKATTPAEVVQANSELGASYYQARRYEDAKLAFKQAYDGSTGIERARHAIDLGNVANAQKDHALTVRFYDEALALANDNLDIVVSVRLNKVHFLPEEDRLTELKAIARIIPGIADANQLSVYRINLGNQALQTGESGTQLAYRQFSAVQSATALQGNSVVRAEALDGLAQLYENGITTNPERLRESQQLNTEALKIATAIGEPAATQLLINLNWRQARLQSAAGDTAAALASYQRTVDLIESIRLDIPIEYDDGRSSYKALLEPVYIGMADLLLKTSENAAPAEQQAYLLRVTQATELLKQTEMQDFLGDRCAIEEIRGGANDDNHIDTNTAVLYPLVFPERTELLLMTRAGMQRFAVDVGRDELVDAVIYYDETLRYHEDDYLEQSNHLYDLLLRPLEKALAENHIKNLVIVPDSSLRVVPFASLHDGKQFFIEKVAVASATGISMTTMGDEGKLQQDAFDNSLVVGMSKPGPVVGKLVEMENNAMDASQGATTNRGSFSVERAASLQKDLALPGVEEEVNGLNSILHGTILLNDTFTLDNFSKHVTEGNYDILHIASHGVFGGTEETSYIMTYDNIIKMNSMQKTLNVGRSRQSYIRLLTLSACQTAEGSTSAPIGISGAAIKARARSVLGTLWPVDDLGAQTFMQLFYQGVANEGLSKAEAVRKAQVQMIGNPELNHPFYWAPFTLIGNWQ